MKVSPYHKSLLKRLLDIVLSLVILIFVLPLIFLIGIINKISSPGPVFFIQKRIGLKGKVFEIIKFRTMVTDAEKLKRKYLKFNESDGPAFKIKDDPRFTYFGKLLSKTGMDELPQFLNVINGDMSIVGPRPLPVDEAKNLSKKDQVRQSVKPGITSTWVTMGSHKLKFAKWMSLDRDYVYNAGFFGDLKIIFQTATLILNFVGRLLHLS